MNIKPCPFCGATVTFYNIFPGWCDEKRWGVRCPTEGCFVYEMEEPIYKTREECESAWNRRTPPVPDPYEITHEQLLALPAEVRTVVLNEAAKRHLLLRDNTFDWEIFHKDRVIARGFHKDEPTEKALNKMARRYESALYVYSQ